MGLDGDSRLGAWLGRAASNRSPKKLTSLPVDTLELRMDTVGGFVTPGIVFLLTLASGLWLNRAGKPLNAAIFTVHKLIALAAVVVTALQTYKAVAIPEVEPIIVALIVALIVVIGLCVVALFATGALMSADKPAYRSLRTSHNLAALLAVIAGVAAIYLLGSMG
jgi:hypothetical protein